MGGYGALRLGAKHPLRFRALSAHSSATALEQLKDVTGEAILPSEPDTVLEWMLTNKAKLPPFRFDCGSDDFLISHNRELHRRLNEAGVAHQYEEFSGGHDWLYWREHIKESLLFFESQLA
jgi:enterochelin esterase-like enzyme